jgi:exonuclease VII small subunit
MSDIDRLNQAREKVDKVRQRRMRLEGEQSAHNENLGKLEQRSRDEFECEVDELPTLIEKLEKEGREALSKAEKLLETA